MIVRPGGGWTALWLMPALLLIPGCNSSPNKSVAFADPAAQLEATAVERGLVRASDDLDPVGVYARGSDRLCIAAAKAGANEATSFRAGVTVDYGDSHACSASGTATRAGDQLMLTLGPNCRFEARIDGDVIRFPGAIAAGCSSACIGRASLSGLSVERISDADAEAVALRDRGGRMLCSD